MEWYMIACVRVWNARTQTKLKQIQWQYIRMKRFCSWNLCICHCLPSELLTRNVEEPTGGESKFTCGQCEFKLYRWPQRVSHQSNGNDRRTSDQRDTMIDEIRIKLNRISVTHDYRSINWQYTDFAWGNCANKFECDPFSTSTKIDRADKRSMNDASVECEQKP